MRPHIDAVSKWYIDSRGILGFRIAAIIEASAQQGALLIGAAFLILVALLGTASRGAILSTGLGLLVLTVLLLGGNDRGFGSRREILIFGGFLLFWSFWSLGIGFLARSRNAAFPTRRAWPFT